MIGKKINGMEMLFPADKTIESLDLNNFLDVNEDFLKRIANELTISSIQTLKTIALQDDSFDENRPWHYTDRCNMCGGVKAFLDWIEKEIERVKP